jgi:membrane protein YdbS with pleckstrin-like domain
VRERLDELTDTLHARHERIRSYIGTALALILLVFTLSDVYDKHSRVYFVLSAAVTLALLALLFWLWIRSDDVATDGYDASG